eukprot:1149421-Pelagomonas_calceolata.AAC.3
MRRARCQSTRFAGGKLSAESHNMRPRENIIPSCLAHDSAAASGTGTLSCLTSALLESEGFAVLWCRAYNGQDTTAKC